MSVCSPETNERNDEFGSTCFWALRIRKPKFCLNRTKLVRRVHVIQCHGIWLELWHQTLDSQFVYAFRTRCDIRKTNVIPSQNAKMFGNIALKISVNLWNQYILRHTRAICWTLLFKHVNQSKQISVLVYASGVLPTSQPAWKPIFNLHWPPQPNGNVDRIYINSRGIVDPSSISLINKWLEPTAISK